MTKQGALIGVAGICGVLTFRQSSANFPPQGKGHILHSALDILRQALRIQPSMGIIPTSGGRRNPRVEKIQHPFGPQGWTGPIHAVGLLGHLWTGGATLAGHDRYGRRRLPILPPAPDHKQAAQGHPAPDSFHPGLGTEAQ